MDLKTLLEVLDIERPEQFVYFDNFADMIEMDMDIPVETLYALVSRVPENIMGELITEYFDDMLEHMQEDETELYTLLETIKMALLGLASNAKGERAAGQLADEIHRFRDWFKFEKNVSCQDVSGKKREDLSIFEAITLHRGDKLDKPGGSGYTFDFEKCLDYELEEYALSFSEE
ncbi:MAG: hypothetical protein FWD00_00240 [Clostridiales bacterium]|nr:hypothetical protein [Clostridiales bacterium]